MKAVNRYLALLLMFLLVLSASICSFAAPKNEGWTVTKYWEKFKNGPPADPAFFPLMVWLQDPANADKYKAAGINTYIGLWKGPKPGEIDTLKAAGMKVVCDMNAEALKYKEDKTIIAWMMLDEPDNWQFKAPITINGRTWKYGPKPSRVSAKDLNDMYSSIKSTDPTRPVISGFGCGVANDDTLGRGPGWNNSMYPDYMRACDFVGFDVYPVSDLGEKFLWFHAKGLDRIKDWTGGSKPRFNAIGPCFTGKNNKHPTPEQVKTEVWISIIHGTKAILWFCHNIKPFVEDALLKNSAMLSAVTKINAQITELAPVINGPDYNGASVYSGKSEVPIDILVKNYKNETYIFAVAMRMGPTTTGVFQVNKVIAAGKVEVLGENRTIDMDARGKFKDDFKTWDVHIYKVIKNN